MIACPRCGAPCQPHHKFCGACATPLQPAPAATPGPTQPVQPSPLAGWAPAPPPPPEPLPPVPRCVAGHEVGSGQAYCAFGHPLGVQPLAGTHPHSPAPPPQAPTGAMSPFAGSPPPPAPPMPVPAPAAVVGAATARPMPAGRRALWGFVVSWHNDPLGTYWPLYAGPNYVGRAGAADGLHIEVADPATSSTHGTVHCDPSTGRVLVEDTGSTNGTFVNEERLPYQGARELRDGDRLRFGSYTVRLLLVPRP